MNARFDLSVYLVTDPVLCAERGVLDVVQRAVAGGATLVQLRDPVAKTGALIELARALLKLLRPAGIPLIINDRVDVALAARAHGVHVGQQDMTPSDARALLGRDAILGLSITALEQLGSPQLQDVDYLGVGPVFTTHTKPDAALPIGLSGLAEIASRTQLPIVAIGGLDASHAAGAMGSGAHGIAVVSAICSAPDPTTAAAQLLAIVHQSRKPLRPTAAPRP